MASTDTRSGFRLPWSSDRSHEDPAPETAAEDTSQEGDAHARRSDPGWPETDISAAGGEATAQPPAASGTQPTVLAEEPDAMVDMDTAVAPAPARPPRKSSKLMADLTAAIRATAEHAREQALSQVESDVQHVVESIRTASAEGAVTLKHQCDGDIAAIREWSKAEIARIREETETRIASRKSTLEEELREHAAAVEHRVEEVQAEVRRFEQEMDSYLQRLTTEQDPARLATMAEEMPETPSFQGWTAFGTPDAGSVSDEAVEGIAEDEAGTAEEPVTAAGWEAAESEADEAAGTNGWAHPANAWEPDAQGAAEQPSADGAAPDASDPDSPRWASGDTPEGFPATDAAEGGDPVDRGAIMAALEAAAEAVVAAEAAAESADQAEAAADLAETAAELLVARSGTEDELEPGAEAALEARVDAGGFETSFADRLASLLPGHGEGAVGDEQRTTQVVVSGLVSVASIASFKRHLARVAGVQNVTVASGPEGEFLFNLTHRADLSFRDAIPTMPGFAARVTSAGDGVVHVTARDPEAEG